jgi:hypothetical protein
MRTHSIKVHSHWVWIQTGMSDQVWMKDFILEGITFCIQGVLRSPSSTGPDGANPC